MQQPINQFGSSSNNFSFIPIILSVVLTAIIFGGGIFWLMNQKQQAVNSEVVSLRNQLKTIPVIPSMVTDNQNTTAPKSNFEMNQTRQARIAELKENPQLTVDNIYDLFDVIPFSEWRDLFDTARKAVVKGSISGMQFDLVFKWKKGNWVYFDVVPENVETDFAQLFMEKVDGRWKVYGPGTAFPDLQEQYPELFK